MQARLRRENQAAKSSLLFRDHEVVKTGTSLEAMELERARTGAARELGAACGLFRVPTVAGQEGPTLRLERLDDIRPLSALLGDDRAGELCHRAGVALAVVHARLHLPDAQRRILTSPFDGPDPVFIHGDYNVSNVQYDAPGDSLVLLDWSTPYWVDPPASHGSALWDVSIFLQNLFHRRIGARDAVRQPGRLGRDFLAGYRSVRELDQAALQVYAGSVLRYSLGALHRSRLQKMSRMPGRWRYRLFLRRLGSASR